jgi:ppGpp synthetase/RelA/SpoT-type nucleotidyltranferase
MKVKLMRRCSDKTYKQLARELKDIYGVAVATSTVHDWCIDGD